MSTNTSPGPPSRGSPKRKRSHTPEYISARNGDAGDDAQLQYAYDLGSDPEETFHTPNNELDGSTPKKRRIERPKKLNYVLYMTLRGHKRGVASVKFSPDGKWIASCCKTTCLGRDVEPVLTLYSCRRYNQDLGRLNRRSGSNTRGPSCRHLSNRMESGLESLGLWFRR
jgi:COMPASS component SWD3